MSLPPSKFHWLELPLRIGYDRGRSLYALALGAFTSASFWREEAKARFSANSSMSQAQEEKQMRREGDERESSELAFKLIEIGASFYARGWALGTSGNYSAVASINPLRLAITASGAEKNALKLAQILRIDADCNTVEGQGRPSAEALVHLTIVRARAAGAVLHTHSIWSTILSDLYAVEGGLSIEGFEMLKGLEGVHTHEHAEWLPIIENFQDWTVGARAVEESLRRCPNSHGFLLRRHGLYTWGRTLSEAKRHVEILEFLLEVTARARLIRSAGDAAF